MAALDLLAGTDEGLGFRVQGFTMLLMCVRVVVSPKMWTYTWQLWTSSQVRWWGVWTPI
jgi:hypothetical protein